MEKQKISPARIFLLLAIIVSIGAALGFLLAAGKIGKINLPVIITPTIDARCGQKVEFSGNCEMASIGFEFDSRFGIGKCISKTGSCRVETPFKNLEECQKTCKTSKISVRLRGGKISQWAVNSDGTVNLVVKFFEDISEKDVRNILGKYAEKIQGPELLNYWAITTERNNITEIAKEDFVQWIDEISPPPTTF